MSKFLLIGPSGIGKSNALTELEEDNTVEIYDLDDLIKSDVGATSISDYLCEVGAKVFFNQSKASIEKKDGERDILIAVGAGSIEFNGGHSWYHSQNTIALIGKPEEIYPRCNRQQYNPTLDAYKAREFSTERQSLYHGAKFVIDITDLTPAEIANKILEIIKSTANKS